MENNFPLYALVAWTVGGSVRAIPELAQRDIELDIEEALRLCRSQHEDSPRGADGRWSREKIEQEIGLRLAISRSFEKLAGSYLWADAPQDAYWALRRAAEICTDCPDTLWIYDEHGVYPTIPLLRRFYAMHGRILQLIRRRPSLRRMYAGSGLEASYRAFSADARIFRDEIREADAYRKGMRLGRR